MNYELIKKIEYNQGVIRAVRFNTDGNYCLACTSDRRIKLYNPQTGLLIKSYDGHGEEVINLVSLGFN